MKRRTFLRQAAAATCAFQFIPRRVVGAPGITPPSRKLNIAAIGCGSQGGNDLNNMAGENIVALCDVDERSAAAAFKQFPRARRFKDFRRMFDALSDAIDGVLVATPDHVHAVATMTALRHGKHVFCEKPLAHSVGELRALRKEAAARQLVTQVGNHGHASDSIRNFVEWVQAGAIGNVTEVHAGCGIFLNLYSRGNRLAAVRSERPPVPAELDWDLWQGPALPRAYHSDYLPFTWRGWLPYGSGAIGDWVCHVVDPVFWALDLDMPVSVCAEVDGYDPVQQSDCYPAGAKITFEFPAKGPRGPLKLVWYDGTRARRCPAELEEGRTHKVEEVGAVVLGDRGKIRYGGHGASGCRLVPESVMQAYQRPEKTIPRCHEGHYQNWLNAIRDGRQAGSPFEYGGRLSEIGLLGVIAVRFPGQKLLYDGAAMRFTNNDAANRWLVPPYRAGWAL